MHIESKLEPRKYHQEDRTESDTITQTWNDNIYLFCEDTAQEQGIKLCPLLTYFY